MEGYSVSDCPVVDLGCRIGDRRGNLTVVENGAFPFDVKRVYYLYDVPGGASRGGELLDEAVAFCRERGLEFYAVNSDVPRWSPFCDARKQAAKVTADVYIDDHNLGGIPDWDEIYRIIDGRRTGRHEKRSRGVFGRRKGR